MRRAANHFQNRDMSVYLQEPHAKTRANEIVFSENQIYLKFYFRSKEQEQTCCNSFLPLRRRATGPPGRQAVGLLLAKPGQLNTILARGGGNLKDPIFKRSNTRGLPGGEGMLMFRVDQRITHSFLETTIFLCQVCGWFPLQIFFAYQIPHLI